MYQISRKYPVLSGTFFTIQSDSRISLLSGEVSGNSISLNCWFFSYTNILEISMHIHDTIIFYNILYYCRKITIFFPIGFFLENIFLESDNVGYSTRRNCFLGYPIEYQISNVVFYPDIPYSVSGNFMIRYTPSKKYKNNINFLEQGWNQMWFIASSVKEFAVLL